MDRVDHDLNEYYKGIEKGERALDNFRSDIEPIVEEMYDLFERMKEIANGYPDYDFDEEIAEQLSDINITPKRSTK